MLNIFKADIYRITRGKALLITLAVILAMNLLMVISLHVIQSGTMDPVAITIGPEMEIEGLEDWETFVEEMPPMTGINVIAFLTQSMENFLFFLLPVIVVVAGAIFTHSTVKNDVSFGIARTKLYMSKLLLSIIIGALFLVFYMGTGMIIATIIGGFGGPAPAGHWANLTQVLGAQFVLITAMVCIGMFFAFTTKRTAAVNAAFIAFILVPALIITILSAASSSFERLFDFDLTSQIMRLADLYYMETYEILRALGVGVFWVLATTLGGIALFRRAEIK